MARYSWIQMLKKYYVPAFPQPLLEGGVLGCIYGLFGACPDRPLNRAITKHRTCKKQSLNVTKGLKERRELDAETCLVGSGLIESVSPSSLRRIGNRLRRRRFERDAARRSSSTIRNRSQ